MNKEDQARLLEQLKAPVKTVLRETAPAVKSSVVVLKGDSEKELTVANAYRVASL
jgi:hypothetical protein